MPVDAGAHCMLICLQYNEVDVYAVTDVGVKQERSKTSGDIKGDNMITIPGIRFTAEIHYMSSDAGPKAVGRMCIQKTNKNKFIMRLT